MARDRPVQLAHVEAIKTFVERWQTLFEADPRPLAVIDRALFGVVWMNPAAVEIFGAADSTAAGARVRDAVPVEALGQVDVEGRWEGKASLPDGTRVRTVAYAVPGPAAIPGVVLVWKRECAARTLTWGLLQTTSNLLVGVDDGRIVYRNAAVSEFFPTSVLGHRARDVLQGAALACIEGAEPEPEETIDADGQRRLVRWRGHVLPNGGSVAIGLDETVTWLATREVQVRVQRLEAMHAISLAIGRGVSLDEVFEMALERLADVVPIKQAALYVIEGETLVGAFRFAGGEGARLDERVDLEAHPAREAVDRRSAVVRETSGPRALQWPLLRSLERAGVAAIAAVPVLAQLDTDTRPQHRADGVLGVLWLATAHRGGFSPNDVEAAEEVAAQLGNAIVRQHLVDRIVEHNRLLEQRVEERTKELKEATDSLIQAAKLSSIGQMASGVAHELNQPLNVISGYIELLVDGELEGEKARKALGVIETSADRMADLVKHLRTFSRASTDKLQRVDVKAVIDVAVQLSSRATRTAVEVSRELPGEAVEVMADPNRLEQVLINLISNAMQATAGNQGHQVRVRLEAAPRLVLIHVEDEGPGVPEELKSRIFTPFFTTKEPGEGTGLGLSISSKIIGDLGGEIRVGEVPDGGAVFTVQLPRLPG